MFHLLQCHGSSASLLFSFGMLSHQLSLLYGGASGENTCLWLRATTSCVFQSLPVTPHCFPLLCSQQYLWEHLCINFLLDYRSHAKDNLAWCGFKMGISLWCCSPLPALICSTLYSPMPDGRLKSIILPTEMCFPEHYIKPQSSVQGVRAGKPARWHCCHTEMSATNGRKAWRENCGKAPCNAEIFVEGILTNNNKETINCRGCH